LFRKKAKSSSRAHSANSPGDRLDAAFEGGRIVLSQKEKPHFEARVIEDPLTGLPVLDFGPGAPILTSEMVAEMLVDFP